MVTSLSYFIVSIPAIVWKGSSKAEEMEHVPALVGEFMCVLCCVVFGRRQHGTNTL